MVDSCYKMFKRMRCCGKPVVKSHRKSVESMFQYDKSDNTMQINKKISQNTTVTSFDNNKLPCDNSTNDNVNNDNDNDDDDNNDIENSLKAELVHLRRHRRPAYFRSFSTSDAVSTDDELMDILCPLPRVNTLERPIIEASMQNNNGR